MTETLADLGEFGLIDRIDELIRKHGTGTPGLTLGLGDDAAAFRPHPDYELLLTCDSVVEGRHYLPGRISPFDLGRRAMALNISDIGAMGGRPLSALVSLGLRAETPVAEVEDMFRGFIEELNPFGASIIGGNLTEAVAAAFIDVTLIGQVRPDRLVRRSTAGFGDAILVTGFPGRAAAGLELLLKARPDDDLGDHPLVRAYNLPAHRAREGQAAADSGLVTAMIDTSDGFLGDLGHICRSSGVGARLFQELLPMAEDLRQEAARLDRDPYDLLLGQSDDYELIITCRAGDADLVRAAIEEVSDVSVAEVGRIVEASEKIRLILPDGHERELAPSGWDHFGG